MNHVKRVTQRVSGKKTSGEIARAFDFSIKRRRIHAHSKLVFILEEVFGSAESRRCRTGETEKLGGSTRRVAVPDLIFYQWAVQVS